MKLSVVTTLYMSAGHIEAFYRRISAAARGAAGDDYELVFVNDGSPDDSFDIVRKLADNDAKLSVVDLSRNFGQHKAMMTGLAHAAGDLVFLLDCDLEEDPEHLEQFVQRMIEDDCDVVYGVQETRRGGAFDRWFGGMFYKLFNFFAAARIPENVTNMRLMSQRYVQALMRHQEREMFMAGLWHITGFKQTPTPVTKHATSKSTYTLAKKISMFVTAVTSFSSAPLTGIFYCGVFISILAAFGILYLFINWATAERPPPGWTSVMASVWLLGGLIISFVGVIGIYLNKIFSETKQRPYTIVRQVYRKHQD